MEKPAFNKPHKKNGLLQIVHDFSFTALNVKDDYSFLDTASHEEKLVHMKERVKKLYDNGYGGICLNVDYTDYLKSEESFLRVKEITQYAKSLGLSVWIYDEQYYPSGSAGGITLEGHPEFEASGLACVSKVAEVKEGEGAIRIPSPMGHSPLKFAFAVPVVDGVELFKKRINLSSCIDVAGGFCYSAPVGTWKVYCFFVRALYEGTKFCLGTRASRRYINVRNKDAVERFYNVTFRDGYEKYMGDVWGDVDAIFTDEPYAPTYTGWIDRGKPTLFKSSSVYDKPNNEIPDYPFVPWVDEFEDVFKEKYGFDFSEILLDIFVNTDKTRYARCCFYKLLSDMAVDAFAIQLRNKFSKSKVAYSGHYYGEEGFDVQPVYYGDILEHLAVMDIPGCDRLKSEADSLRYSIACKLASSAAHITNKDKVLIEASNMSDKDQNITMKIAKAAIGMMVVHGLNVISSYYGENIFDEDGMKEFADYVTNIVSLFEGGKYVANTFMYYPFEELCARCVPEGEETASQIGFQDSMDIEGSCNKLFGNQVTFDFINKKYLMECEIKDGYIQSPNGNKIYTIAFPKISFVDCDLAKYLEKAYEKGIRIVVDGEKRDIENLSFMPEFDLALCSNKDMQFESNNPMITFMNSSFENYNLYMFMNTEDKNHNLKVNVKASENERFAIVDVDTYEVLDIAVEYHGDTAKINLDIPALSPVVLCKY